MQTHFELQDLENLKYIFTRHQPTVGYCHALTKIISIHEERSDYIFEEALHQYCVLCTQLPEESCVSELSNLSREYKLNNNYFQVIQNIVGMYAIENKNISAQSIESLLDVIPQEYWAYSVLHLRKMISTIHPLFQDYTKNNEAIFDILHQCIEKGSMWAITEIYSSLSEEHKKYIHTVSEDKTKLTRTKRHELREFIRLSTSKKL